MQFLSKTLALLATAAILYQPIFCAINYPQITVFNKPKYGGANRTYDITTNTCYTLGPYISKKLKSIKIGRPLTCQLYPQAKCLGKPIANFKFVYANYPDVKTPYSTAMSFRCLPANVPKPATDPLNTVSLYPQPNFLGPLSQTQTFQPLPRECLLLRPFLQKKVQSARFGANLTCLGYQTPNCTEGRPNLLGNVPFPVFLLTLDYPNTRKGRGGEDLARLVSFECNR